MAGVAGIGATRDGTPVARGGPSRKALRGWRAPQGRHHQMHVDDVVAHQIRLRHVADVACGGMHDTFSMGVSRKGRAWIQYLSGDLYTVVLTRAPLSGEEPSFVADGSPVRPPSGVNRVQAEAPPKMTAAAKRIAR